MENQIGGMFVMFVVVVILVAVAALFIFLFKKFDDAQAKDENIWLRNMIATPFLLYYRKKIQLCGKYGFGSYEYKRKEEKLLSYIKVGLQ